MLSAVKLNEVAPSPNSLFALLKREQASCCLTEERLGGFLSLTSPGPHNDLIKTGLQLLTFAIRSFSLSYQYCANLFQIRINARNTQDVFGVFSLEKGKY